MHGIYMSFSLSINHFFYSTTVDPWFRHNYWIFRHRHSRVPDKWSTFYCKCRITKKQKHIFSEKCAIFKLINQIFFLFLNTYTFTACSMFTERNDEKPWHFFLSFCGTKLLLFLLLLSVEWITSFVYFSFV